MPDGHYEAGAHVPPTLAGRTAPEDLRFSISVDVYVGYGDQRHVYPTESVDSRSEILTDDVDHLGADVSLYTVPHEQLR